MRARPLWDRIILRVIRDNTTKSGLHVPEIVYANSPFERGEVLVCGPGALLDNGTVRPMSVKEGDIVWFAKGTVVPIPYEGFKAGEAVMAKEENIMAILTELDRATGLVDVSGSDLVVRA